MIKQDLRPYADCYNVESVYYSGSDTESYPELDVDAMQEQLWDTEIALHEIERDMFSDLSGDEYADAILSTIA